MVEEKKGKCYNDPVTAMVFKTGCDDWYLEEITIERIINDKVIWKSTCNYGLWLTYCYSNALCKNGRAIFERP